MSKAPPVNNKKGASNKSGDDQGLQSNCPKEKLPWAPKPKQPKKSWGNIVQKAISSRRQVGNT
jgi:hypothetical protein